MTRRDTLLEALASTPADIARLVARLDETAAVWRPAGGWTCREVVAHLCHIEPLSLARLARVVAEREPSVATIYPDEAAHDNALGIVALAAQFAEERTRTLAFLRELSPGAWQRAATHETRGRVTLRFLVQMMVDHDIAHTNQLVTVKGQARAAIKPAAPAM